MTSVFNVHTLGIKNFDNLITDNIKDSVKNNRILLTTDINTESYKLILPTFSPKFSSNYLVANDNGELNWIAPTIANDILPTSPEGPPLIYENGEYIFSPNIKNMISITGNNYSDSSINFHNNQLSLKKNNTFINLNPNSISLGVNQNNTSSIDIMDDKIIINKPLILGRYKLEVIDDELVINKYDPNTDKYIPGTVII
jgi:hypothetical protein